MTDHPKNEDAIDVQLVAYLHGELDSRERRSVSQRLARDADARARLAVLESTDIALGEALDREHAPRQAPRFYGIVQPLLAVAAVLAVVAIFVFAQQEEQVAVSRNQHIEVRMAPLGGATTPLFTDAAFELFWKNLDPNDPKRVARVLPFAFGQTRNQLRDDLNRATRVGSRRMPVLPLIITAVIHDPEGNRLQARLSPRDLQPWEIHRERATQTIRLRDFEVVLGTMRPTLIGNPGDREWQDDARWGLKNMGRKKNARWFPEIPGEWRIDLEIETLPPPQGNPWPSFSKPLVISSSIMMTGEMTDWGKAHDGMRARLVWSTGARTANTTPFAVQIKNEGKEPRKYNYGGTTIAKIPQPMHFTLVVDGEPWTQQDRVPMILAAGDLFQPHPVGAVRSIVTRAGFWHRDGKRLGELPGQHTVELLFHFEPSIWNAADTSIWLGKLPTPKLTIDVPKAR